jgi:hypothetical protein
MGCLYTTPVELPEDKTPFKLTYKLYADEFKALRLKESDVEMLYNIYDSLDDKKTVCCIISIIRKLVWLKT